MAKPNATAAERTGTVEIDGEEVVLHDGRVSEVEADEVVLVEDETPPARGTEKPADGQTGEEGRATARGKGDLGKAVKKERGRVRSIKAELEATRRQLAEKDAQLAAAQEANRRKERLDKLDEVEDLKDAVPLVTEEVSAQVAPAIERTRARFVLMSQKLAMREHSDFEEVLTKSGVTEAIELVKGPDGKLAPRDPVMWKRLFEDSDDPGEDAYELAAEILRDRGERVTEPDDTTEVLDDKPGDRASGRREVIDTVRTNAERPLSIRHVPASDATVKRAYTRSDIDKMSDAEYARLPAHVRRQYLGGPRDE